MIVNDSPQRRGHSARPYVNCFEGNWRWSQPFSNEKNVSKCCCCCCCCCCRCCCWGCVSLFFLWPRSDATLNWHYTWLLQSIIKQEPWFQITIHYKLVNRTAVACKNFNTWGVLPSLTQHPINRTMFGCEPTALIKSNSWRRSLLAWMSTPSNKKN